MSEFKIQIENGRNEITSLHKAASDLESLYNDLLSVKKNLRFQVAAKSRIDQRINTSLSQIANHRNKTIKVGSALESIIKEYENTENKLSNGSNNLKFGSLIYSFLPTLSPADLSTATTDTTNGGNAPRSILDLFSNWKDGDYEKERIHGAKVDLANKDLVKNNKIADKVDEIKDTYQENKTFYQGEYDSKTKTWKKVDEKNEQEKEEFKEHNKNKVPINVKLYGDEHSWEKSARDYSGTAGDKDGTHASGSVKVATLKAEAEYYVGTMGLAGSAGASYTAFSIDEEAQLGNDMLGIYEKGSVTAGKYEAKVEGSVGLFDKDHKFNPNVYVGGKAEAIVAEASLTVGGKVAGVDVGVKASVNYGVGVHLNAGIHDGKISLDFGATLGVGGSVAMEIDVSGAVDAVYGAAKSAYDWVKGWFH